MPRLPFPHRAISCIVGLSLYLTACADCAPVGRPAFAITVVDFTTGRPAAAGAVAYLLRHPDSQVVSIDVAHDSVHINAGWGQQGGTFDLLIERSGYWTWAATNQRVVEDESCSTRTISLIARLRPRSS